MWEELRGVERCGSCQYIEGSFDSYWGSVSMRKYNIFPSTHPILFQPLFTLASFYHKTQESMQMKEIPRKSKVL